MIKLTELPLEFWVAYVVVWFNNELEYNRIMVAAIAAIG